MKKWIPTVVRKIWCGARHGFQAVETSSDPRASALSPRDHADLPEILTQEDRRLSAPPGHPGPAPISPDADPHARIRSEHSCAGAARASNLSAYLLDRENRPEDILKLDTLLSMPQVLLEIGCGDAEAARRIALENPGIGVIATDLYDWLRPQRSGNSYYGRIAGIWRSHRLPAQMDPPPNLVVLRAEADLLRLLPDRVVDTLLALNPEPAVGRSLLELIRRESLLSKIKQNAMQIVILPYSRELGVMACGGCQFEHDPDWSRGLGFIMGSGLAFRRGDPFQWGVDLTRLSAYTGNSTQKEIYICGQLPA